LIDKRNRFRFDEKDFKRARDRIQQALSRLTTALQTLSLERLQHIKIVVERTAIDVADTRAGVERTAKDVADTRTGVEQTGKCVERTERGVERTEKSVARTEICVEETKTGVERTERRVERTEEGVELTRAGVDQLQEYENVKHRTTERQKIIDWVCPSEVDYIDQQNALVYRRQEGIGEWFLETHEYKSWLRGNHTALLCSGMPGVGKTMITSFVVSNVLKRYDNDNQTGVVYIYCQYPRHKEQTPEYLMSSILRQLLEQQNTVSDEVTALYKSKKEGKHKLAPYETSDLLNAVLNLFKKTFIIIDALDELRSTDCNGFMAQVFSIQQKFNVNVYVTSRFTGGIAHKASHACQFVIRARKQDMRQKVDMTLRRGSLLSERPDLLEKAVDKVLHLADGMYVPKHPTIQNSDQCVHVLTIYRFLLAVLYAQHLADLDLIGDLVGAIDNLEPVSDPYGNLYTSTMKRIQARRTGDTNLALTTICWLFFAKRPLRHKELLHALAFSGNTPKSEKNIPTISHVLNICAGLVVVNEVRKTVGFFHKSFDDFLGKSHTDFFPRGDQTLGTTCVRYLSMDAFASGPCENRRYPPDPKPATLEYGDRLTQYPLYGYAQLFWYDHIRGSELETSNVVLNFLREHTKLSASYQRDRHQQKYEVPRTTGAHVAAEFMLERSLVRHLELCRSDVNVLDSDGRSPLSYAAETNGLIAIDHLIHAGANPDFEDSWPGDVFGHKVGDYTSQTRCHTSQARGYTSLGYTPLANAALKGHLTACKALVQGGADVNYRDGRGRSALSYVTEGASEAVARFLLQNGASIDLQDTQDLTPLCWVAANGSFEAALLLLDHGAAINSISSRNKTPLIMAAKAGHERMISLLIARGADVNVLSCDNETSLCHAINQNLVDSVRLLLHAGADVNIGTNPGHPLPTAIEIGSKEIAHLLLSAGSDVNLNSSISGLSPLYWAATNGWTDVAQLLLDKGADPSIGADPMMTRFGCHSVLSRAVEAESMEMVELLLERGADINQVHQRIPFCLPLYFAFGMKWASMPCARPVDECMVNFLLSKGANPNQIAELGKWLEKKLDPPLLHVLQHLPTGDALTGRLVQLLLDHGARTDVVTWQGLSVVECAKHHPKEVQDMIRRYGAK
jgi:ankyrin repeat protein